MKILLLGDTGMLGQACVRNFKHISNLVTCSQRYSVDNRSEYIQEILDIKPDVIILAIGKIKQVSGNLADLFLINNALVADVCYCADRLQYCKVIYPSTDCVFSGDKKSSYNKLDFHTASDFYGLTKSIGERIVLSHKNNVVLRTSIIGPDVRKNGKGLWNWVHNWDDSIKKGFINHHWNGVTTDYWCEFVIQNIIKREPTDCLIQIGSTKITKYELVKKIAKKLRKKNKIEEHDDLISISRILKSDYKVPSIGEQIECIR